MDKKLKIDPKVEYDGRSFRLVISNKADEDQLLEQLKKEQAEIIQDILERDDEKSEPGGKAAKGISEIHP